MALFAVWKLHINGVGGNMEQNLKCLVVDDEKSNLDAFLTVFGDDFDLVPALSGREALTILDEDQSIAVVVSDQRMDEMTGVELLEEVKKKYPEIVRIVLTGYSDYQVSIDAINKGDVFRYLHKPIDMDETTNAIEEGLKKYKKSVEEKKSIEDTKEQIRKRFLEINESLGAGIAHYVNNGLVPAKTFLTFLPEKAKELKEGNYDSTYFENFLEEAVKNIEGIEGLTESLLWAHNAQIEGFESVPVSDVFDLEASEFKDLLSKKNLKINSEMERDLPSLFVDKIKVKEMFVLLLKFCAVASSEGQSIEIRASKTTDQPDVSSVRFEIGYHGKGYAPKDIPRIFDPFYKFDEQLNTEVKGLELTNCYITSLKHGFELKVESDPGKETAFIVDLPFLVS